MRYWYESQARIPVGLEAHGDTNNDLFTLNVVDLLRSEPVLTLLGPDPFRVSLNQKVCQIDQVGGQDYLESSPPRFYEAKFLFCCKKIHAFRNSLPIS